METPINENSERSDSVYKKIIRSLSNQEADEINILLETLAGISENIGSIIANLKNEQNLPEEYMVSILGHLSSNISSDKCSQEVFFAKYKETCKKYSLKGGEIKTLSSVQYFGNAVFKEELISRIFRIIDNDDTVEKYPKIRDHIRLYIDNLIQHKDIDSLDHLNGILIHYPTTRMWATWVDTEGGNPFDFRKTVNWEKDPPYSGSLCEVRLNLALAPNDPSDGYESMLLLTYNTDEIEAYIPTIADAETYQYFSPCSQGSKNGWTNPFHPELQKKYIECLMNSSHSQYSNEPRPEAVHRPITLGDLHRIEELLPISKVTI
jgi:hypothetical protein